MALTKTVTIKKIIKNGSRGGDGKYTVSLNLKVNDGSVDVIDSLISELYIPSNDTIAGLQERFRVKMQKLIDDYKLGDNMTKNAQVITMASNVEVSIVV